MNIPSPCPSVHHLGIAGDDLDAGGAAAAPMRSTICARSSTEAFLDDEAGRKVDRTRAAHGQVVHRAVHGQIADVTAGEKDRVDHVGVGAERESCAVDGKDCASLSSGFSRSLRNCGRSTFASAVGSTFRHCRGPARSHGSRTAMGTIPGVRWPSSDTVSPRASDDTFFSECDASQAPRAVKSRDIHLRDEGMIRGLRET